MDRHRRKLATFLSAPSVTVIIVENFDRLARFGFEHPAASMASRRAVKAAVVATGEQP